MCRGSARGDQEADCCCLIIASGSFCLLLTVWLQVNKCLLILNRVSHVQSIKSSAQAMKLSHVVHQSFRPTDGSSIILPVGKLLPEEPLLYRYFLPVKKFLPEELQQKLQVVKKCHNLAPLDRFDSPLVYETFRPTVGSSIILPVGKLLPEEPLLYRFFTC
jgi:hypothetical protein